MINKRLCTCQSLRPRQQWCATCLIGLLAFHLFSTMSKRGGDLIWVWATKVRKCKGVGSHTFTVLDSNHEDPSKVSTEYAWVTKTQVTTSGKRERITTSSVPVFEMEEASVDIHVPPEVNADNFIDTAAENVLPMVLTKKRWKRGNDSVSSSTFWPPQFH